MSAVFQDISVSISQRRRTCVIDPALALSPYGIPLVSRLVDSLELWLPREFWHILDSTQLHPCQSYAFDEHLQNGEPSVWRNEETIFQAMHEWEKIRAESDPTSMKLFWIGDGLGESILPGNFGSSIIVRFEALCCSLDKRLQSENLLAWAFRDAVALSVTLPSAIILTQMNTDFSGYSMPAICSAFREWNLEYVEIDGDDEWLHMERDYFRQKMVLAGLAKLRWSGLRLAVIHIDAPVTSLLDRNLDENADELSVVEEVGYESSVSDYWQGSKAFWYPL